jgi:predicted nucleic acid-binding protein
MVVKHDYVFDSGALGQLAGGDADIEALVNRIRANDGRAFVPAVILAECFGDSRYDAKYGRALKALSGGDDCVVDIDAATALRAGGILRAAKMKETIDAIVVAVAESLGPKTSVVTGDLLHIKRLAVSAKVKLGVIDTR